MTVQRHDYRIIFYRSQRYRFPTSGHSRFTVAENTFVHDVRWLCRHCGGRKKMSSWNLQPWNHQIEYRATGDVGWSRREPLCIIRKDG